MEHAAETILWPAMAKVQRAYPDVNVEIINDYGLIDIVAGRYDAGVRLGEQVDKDMTPLRIGPDFRIAVVAAPSYFNGRRQPRTPQELTQHGCINLRLPTHGGFYVWEFRKGGRGLNVRVQGRTVFNAVTMMRHAALEGLGLRLPAGRHGGSGNSERSARACSRGLVSAASRVSPVLPEPPPTLASLRACSGCAPSQSMNVV